MIMYVITLAPGPHRRASFEVGFAALWHHRRALLALEGIAPWLSRSLR
jgi:hypothetical protein